MKIGGFLINICVLRHFMVFFRVGQDEQKNLIQDFLDKRNMMTLVLYLTPAGVLTADEESPPSSKTKVRNINHRQKTLNSILRVYIL